MIAGRRDKPCEFCGIGRSYHPKAGTVLPSMEAACAIAEDNYYAQERAESGGWNA